MRARRSKRPALAAEGLSYADASALVKLVIAEPETEALREHVLHGGRRIATSRVAVVEVSRAVRISNPSIEGQARARELFERALLVDVSAVLLNAAAALASRALPTLDAIHLATLQLVDPDEVVVYDRRLIDATRALGYRTVSPGADY